MTADENRQMHLHSLDTFLINVYNSFEYVADEALKRLKDETAKDYKEYEDLESQNKPTLGSEADEEPLTYLMRTQESSRVMLDIMYQTEEMIALLEMKIIYAYKHFEINTKRLISLAYGEDDVKGLLQQKHLKDLLRSKSIDPHNLRSWTQVDELRLVNNMIKHSGKGTEKIRAIREFQQYEFTQFEPLNLFYTRIKPAPMDLLNSLKVAIINHLYPEIIIKSK